MLAGRLTRTERAAANALDRGLTPPDALDANRRSVGAHLRSININPVTCRRSPDARKNTGHRDAGAGLCRPHRPQPSPGRPAAPGRSRLGPAGAATPRSGGG